MYGQLHRTPGSVGCENLRRLAVSAVLLALTACGGGGSEEQDTDGLDITSTGGVPERFAEANSGLLTAATDVAETVAGESIVLALLNNDSFVDAGNTEIHLGTPSHGSVTLLESGEIEYVPDADFEGTDEITYRLVDADGNESVGSIYIAVACAGCTLASVPTTETTSPSGNPYCQDAASDDDGDGYGWENGASCEIREPSTGAALPALSARSDSITIEAGDTTAVSALRNDLIPDRNSVTVSIDAQPSAGSIVAHDQGVIVYAAPDRYAGSDSIVYSISDDDGNTSVASIDFDITCEICDVNALRLSWPANPESEDIDGYRIFFGPDENSFTSSMLSQVNLNDSNFSADEPSVVYSLDDDLNVSGNEGGCFRVTAFRGGEESEPSEPVCFTLG